MHKEEQLDGGAELCFEQAGHLRQAAGTDRVHACVSGWGPAGGCIMSDGWGMP